MMLDHLKFSGQASWPPRFHVGERVQKWTPLALDLEILPPHYAIILCKSIMTHSAMSSGEFRTKTKDYSCASLCSCHFAYPVSISRKLYDA